MDKGEKKLTFFLWRRFAARLFDFLLALSFCYVLVEALFLDPARHSLLCFLLLQCLALALAMLLEPFFLAFWGKTPGKGLLGLTLTNLEGRRLSLSQARRRTWQLWREGLGLGLPFYRILGLARSYAVGRQGGSFSWEQGSVLT